MTKKKPDRAQVERVAKVIHQEIWKHYGGLVWMELTENGRKQLRREARAAIAAMDRKKTADKNGSLK